MAYYDGYRIRSTFFCTICVEYRKMYLSDCQGVPVVFDTLFFTVKYLLL